MAQQGKRRTLEYQVLAGENAYALQGRVSEHAKDDWRIVVGSFQATTFGFFIWMERFSDVA